MPSGFFVNATTGDRFDPRPATHAHFRPTLFECLLSLSPALKTAWEKYTTSISQPSLIGSKAKLPLSILAAHFASGRGDSVVSSQWTLPPPPSTPSTQQGSGSAGGVYTHKKDAWRSLVDATEGYGVSVDQGPPREWLVYTYM